MTLAVVRCAVALVRTDHGLSERRACLVLGADRSTVCYRSQHPDDAVIRKRLRKLLRQRRRFGCRHLHLLLAREGQAMNQKKLRRLYREEKLQARRGGRKRALSTRAPLALPQRPNGRWSLDFVADSFSDGRRFRILAVVEDFTRECLALVAAPSLSGARVAREIDTPIARGPAPRCSGHGRSPAPLLRPGLRRRP